MLNFIQGSKYQAETVSIVLSFADILQPGDTITGTPVVTVTVATGFDSNPSNLLYQGVTVTGGNTVEQRFRLGIPGVIYVLLFTVQTVAGDTLDKECYLAIIPDADNAVPNWLPLWETTQLYPYQVMEQLTSRINWTGGRLITALYRIPAEYVQSLITIVGGTLQNASVTYNIPHEDLKSLIALVGGTLQNASVTYNIPHEDLQARIALIGGTLQNASIVYNIPHEDIQGFINLTGGTLV